MADGRLEALTVTGPGGADVIGAPRRGDDSDDDEARDASAAEGGAAGEGGAGGPMRGKDGEGKKPAPKPYTAFKPRALARKPAPPPKGKPAPPKPAGPS